LHLETGPATNPFIQRLFLMRPTSRLSADRRCQWIPTGRFWKVRPQHQKWEALVCLRCISASCFGKTKKS
jgi:hypothetical protein